MKINDIRSHTYIVRDMFDSSLFPVEAPADGQDIQFSYFPTGRNV